MSKPRVLLLTIPALGFSAYADGMKMLEVERDFDVTALTLTAPLAQKVLTRKLPGERGVLVNAVRRRLVWLAHLPWLLRTLRTGSFSAMHGAPQLTGPLLLAAHRRTGVPYSLGMDSTVPLNAGVRPWPSSFEILHRIDGESIRGAEFVAAWSEWAARSVRADYGARVIVTPPGLDVDAYRQRDGGREGPVRILFIGNDWKRKGGDRLVRWHQEHLGGTELHLVGQSVPELGDLPGVVRHGFVERSRLLSDLVPSCDVLALPTRQDMSPYVIAEAATAGLPVVSSRLAGIPELIRDGRTGFVCDTNHDEQFVAALSRLANDRQLIDRQGRLARAFALETFAARTTYRPIVEQLTGRAVLHP